MDEHLSYLTKEVLAEFSGTGTENLIQVIENPDSSGVEKSEVIGSVFAELLMVYEDGKLDITSILEFLSACIKEEETAEKFCQVLDVFPLTDSIGALIKRLHDTQKVIKPATIAKYVTLDTLGDIGIIPKESSKRQFNTRKRDKLFTQKKFNLLFEESEGYSRLIVEVYNVLRNDDSKYQVQYCLKIIDSLIGHYGLDTNKVFDVLIDVFANNLVGNTDFIISFWKNSRWWPSVESDNSSIETLSDGGDSELAKLIGHRFLVYPADKALPETLKLLIAILIKEGMFSFGSIYKFLNPSDEEMKQFDSIYKKDLDDQAFKSSANALALAAPLMEEEEEDAGKTKNSSTKPEDIESLEAKLSYNQKFQMLRVFLSIGLYWPSIYILTEYPVMAKIDEECRDLVFRLLKQIISPIFQKLIPFTPQEMNQLQTSKKIAFSRGNNTVSHEDFECTTLLSFRATLQGYSQKSFVYFYESWTDDLPVLSTMDDFFIYSKQLIKFLGVNIAKDIQLFSQICEIGINDLETNGDDETVKQNWYLYVRNYIFPAISLIEENNLAVSKAYKILSFYPQEIRFNLYSELHQVLSKSNPLIKISYGKAEKSTKDVLKRLSKETVRPMMRRIAKISYSNPLPCFLTILQQIESYDNLNSLVVETARYFNEYGWDVLGLAIMIRLTASGRSNIQASGLHERQWIQSLASFIGKICQRYPNAIDIKILLEFLLKSFHTGDTTGLIVLKEILMAMGGIQTISNLTLDQISRLNSGEVLQKQVFKTINDCRYDRLKSGTILVKNLINLDSVNELLVLLCQIEESIVFGEDNTHLKILASRKDDLITVVQLFTDLVSFFAVGDEVQQCLMPISQLCNDYKVPAEWAFQIWRKYLDIEGTIINQELNQFQYNVEAPKSLELYGFFWQFSLYSINFNEQIYDEMLTKVNKALPTLESAYSRSKRSYDSKQTIDEKGEALETAKSNQTNIPIDKENHKVHYDTVITRLKCESQTWFEQEGSIKNFLQYCVLPRAITSSYDAVYSAKFLFKLFEHGVNNFSLVTALTDLIKGGILFGTLFTSTPLESENLGVFYAEILTTINSWHSSEQCPETKLGMEFTNYKSLLYEYHTSLLEDLSKTLKSTDYMCRRNAITFLKNILSIYPMVEDHCIVLSDLIQNIIDTEDREDLKLASNALIGHLKSRSKSWLPLWEFIDLSDEEVAALKKVKEEAEEKIRQEQEAKKLAAKKLQEEKLAAEKAKQQSKRLSYEGGSSDGLRSSPRVTGKKRHDYYSKYEESAEESSQKENEESSQKDDVDMGVDHENGEPVEAVVEVEESKEAEMDVEAKDEEKEEEVKETKPDEPTHEEVEVSKPEEIKPRSIYNKLPRAPQANVTETVKETTHTPPPPSGPSAPSAPAGPRVKEPARSRTPLGPQAVPHNPVKRAPLPPQRAPLPAQRAPLPPQRAPLPPQTLAELKRAPLGPQSSSRQHGGYYQNDSRYRGYDQGYPRNSNQGKYSNQDARSSNHQDATPPPPPPPPPANPPPKRKYEGGNGRYYDKRQRY